MKIAVDFDGTLVDSMPTFVSVMLRILDENNIKYGSEIVKTITPLGYKGTAEYYKTLGISLTVEEMLEKTYQTGEMPSLYKPEVIVDMTKYDSFGGIKE